MLYDERFFMLVATIDLLNKSSLMSRVYQVNSNLTDRRFVVSMGTCSSGIHEIKCDVLQGSISGQICF